MSQFPAWTVSDQSSNHTIQSSNISSNNLSALSGCITLKFKDYIPWDNPSNIVSLETEDFVRMLKDLVFLPLLFLIGVPSNIINMAVFYKQGLKERINVCLFALALADGLLLACNMVIYGEQLQLRFTNKHVTFGPVMEFMTNNNLIMLHGFPFVSEVITAVIASERCFCILHPLRSQTVLSTSTMTIIIVVIYVGIMGLYGVVSTRYRIACIYNPVTKTSTISAVYGEFYRQHQKLIDNLNSFFFGLILPTVVIVVVVTTTIITTLKLRQAATWRARTSSSGGLSEQEITLTKMLVANSIFFFACVFPSSLLRFSFMFMPEVNSGGRNHNYYMMILWIIVISTYFNAAFNIVVYYTMGSRYRQTFWQLFRITRTCRRI